MLKNMRKLLLLGLISLLLHVLSSCVPETIPPVGIWRNEDLNIVLYVKPEYRSHLRFFYTYLGLIDSNGDGSKLFAEFGNGPRLTIFEATLEGEGRQALGDWLIGGTFRVAGDEFHLNLGT